MRIRVLHVLSALLRVQALAGLYVQLDQNGQQVQRRPKHGMVPEQVVMAVDPAAVIQSDKTAEATSGNSDIDIAQLLSHRSDPSVAGAAEQSSMLLKLVTGVYASKKTPNANKIKVIKSIVNDEILPDLMMTHERAGKQVLLNLAAINECNDHASSSFNHITTVTVPGVDERRKQHTQCRLAQNSHNVTKTEKCRELDSFLDGIVEPARLPPKGQGTAKAIVKYMESSRQYFCPKGPQVKEMSKECEETETKVDSKKAECDRDQASFELSMCTWRTEVLDTCAALNACYEHAVQNYNHFVKETQALIIKWKIEYSALKKILCFVDTWLSDNNTDTADADVAKGCTELKIDDSSMNVDIPEVPPQLTCNTREVNNPPGTRAFQEIEYDNSKELSNYVTEVIPCVDVIQGHNTTFRMEQDSVRIDGWQGGTKCQWIAFQQAFEKTPYVQVTVDHRGSASTSWENDAVTLWMQEVSKENFKVCVRELDHYSSGKKDDLLHVSYMAFEGAPQGSVIGNATMDAYTTDYKCDWILYGKQFNSGDQVKVVTTIYHDPGTDEKPFPDALTEWAQEVESERFRACVRETSHHDGKHSALHMGFLAWTEQIPGMQDGRVKFEAWSGGTKCQEVHFESEFINPPVVQATVNHQYDSANVTTNDAITIWLEDVRKDKFKACVRELAEKKYGDGAHEKLMVDWLAREALRR